MSSEEATVAHTMRQDLYAVLSELTEREAGVVTMRFGLDDGHEKTLDEIGKALNVSITFAVGRVVGSLHSCRA